MTIQVLLTEPDYVGQLYPMSETSAAWELRLGMFSILERWQASVPDVVCTVTSHRHDVLESFEERVQVAPFAPFPTLSVLGNVLLAPAVMRQMIDVCRNSARSVVFLIDDSPIAAWIPHPAVSTTALAAAMEQPDAADIVLVEGYVVTRLWQAFDVMPTVIGWDAELLPRRHSFSDQPNVVVDERHGPVLFGDNVHVEPFTTLIGPLAIGNGTQIKSHSRISSSTIGPTCKIAGEIEDSIFHGFANKQHDGFVGHSWIGSWVNLGAGTTTSDLKNTYGEVHVSMPWSDENTGRMLLGTLMGDHSKTAIGTRLTTGSVIGCFANIVTSTFAPRAVLSFSWCTENSVVTYSVDRALQTAHTVMRRRNVRMKETTEQLYRSIAEARRD